MFVLLSLRTTGTDLRHDSAGEAGRAALHPGLHKRVLHLVGKVLRRPRGRLGAHRRSGLFVCLLGPRVTFHRTYVTSQFFHANFLCHLDAKRRSGVFVCFLAWPSSQFFHAHF